MNKKWLLGLGGIAAIALPVSTVVACGDDTPKKPADVVLKEGDKFTLQATTEKEAQKEFNKEFKMYIEKAGKGFDANVDKGKEATGSSKTDAITNPVALATKDLVIGLNGKTIVKIFTKGNNTLFLLKEGTTTRPEKEAVANDMQLTYHANRSDDNDASKAVAGLMADFGNKDQPKELHDAISNDKSVTSILGFYNYAQQEKDGGAYVQRLSYYKGLYDIKGQAGLVNDSSNVEGNFKDIKIEAKYDFTKALNIMTDFKSTLNKAEMKAKFSGKTWLNDDWKTDYGFQPKADSVFPANIDMGVSIVKTPYDDSTGKVVVSVSIEHYNNDKSNQYSEFKDITITAKDA